MSKLKSKYAESQQSSTDEEDDLEVDEEHDQDIIRCECGDTTDDGLSIQCEKCDTWQHGACVNIKRKKDVPEHYICDRCNRKSKKKTTATAPQNRRRNSSDTEVDRKKKSPVKRSNNSKKPVLYQQDSDENENDDNQQPPRISRKKFTPLSKSVMKEKLVEDLFIAVYKQWIELNRPKGGKKSSTSTPTNIKELDSIIVMESNLLLPSIPKASVKPIRRSLRTAYSPKNQNDPSIQKGLFADIHIPENRYLMEVTGEVLRKSEYKKNAGNKYSTFGTPLPHVFFYPHLDFCIDARYAGNDTRYIRRSCCPNSEIKSIILPNDSEDHSIHMGIYTKEAVDKHQEITIGWKWNHEVAMYRKSKEFVSKGTVNFMNTAEKRELKNILDLITTEFGKCACEDENECLLEYLKDELEMEQEEDMEIDNASSSSSASKKKRPASSSSSKSRQTIKSALRVSNIFTSDEDGENTKPNKGRGTATTAKPEKKRVKFIDKSTTNTKSIIPSSPAVSVEDSVDIDITSISPAPTVNSENEMETIGSKRARSTGIQLPCKKRWLKEYIVQQQKEKALEEQQKVETSASPKVETTSSFTTIPPPIVSPEHIAKELEHVYDEGELSDGGSSQSTLPLDDTPAFRHHQPTEVDIKEEEPMDISTMDESKQNNDTGVTVDHVTAKLDSDVLVETLEEIAQQPNIQKESLTGVLLETITNNEEIPAPSNEVITTNPEMAVNKESSESKSVEKIEEPTASEEPPAPKVKLSIQEYLKRQRGNLPTPDEKS